MDNLLEIEAAYRLMVAAGKKDVSERNPWDTQYELLKCPMEVNKTDGLELLVVEMILN